MRRRSPRPGYACRRDSRDPADVTELPTGIVAFLRSRRHPAWRGVGESARKPPPLRGLLVAAIVREDGLNYGLLQVLPACAG